MSKIEEAKETPREDLMNSALSHYEEASKAIHCWNSSIPNAIRQYFATSQPLNLDVKVNDDWEKVDVPVNYDKFANKNKFKLNEKSFKPEWIAECKEYQQAKTVREKIAELNEDNEQLENDLRNMANLVGFQSNQIEQLTQERDFWKIGSFDDKFKAVTKERDELEETLGQDRMFNKVDQKCHEDYATSLEEQLSAEKQNRIEDMQRHTKELKKAQGLIQAEKQNNEELKKELEVKFYQKLEKKLEKIVNAEMDVVDYYYKICEKVEQQLNK